MTKNFLSGEDMEKLLWGTYNNFRDNIQYAQIIDLQKYAASTLLSLLYEFVDNDDIEDAEFRAYMKYARQWFADNEEELTRGL